MKVFMESYKSSKENTLQQMITIILFEIVSNYVNLYDGLNGLSDHPSSQRININYVSALYRVNYSINWIHFR